MESSSQSVNNLKTLNWVEFFRCILSFTIYLFILFIFGSRIVLACKYAHANLLPTNSDCMPYTSQEAVFDIKEPEMNIDKISIPGKTSDNGETSPSTMYATKIVFPFTENTTSHFMIDKLKKAAEDHSISGIKMFLVEGTSC